MTDYDYLFKLIILGDVATGKTTLMTRFIDNSFNNHYGTTVGVNFMIKNYTTISNRKTKLQIWDTAGQERFRIFVKKYYRGAQGIFICFDLNNRESFNNIKYWIDEAKINCDETISQILLVGTKSDLPKLIKEEEIKKVCDDHNVCYIETSSKYNSNCDLAFDTLIEILIKYYPSLNNKVKNALDAKGTRIGIEDEKKQTKCCK